jgi:hypothetical protein
VKGFSSQGEEIPRLPSLPSPRQPIKAVFRGKEKTFMKKQAKKLTLAKETLRNLEGKDAKLVNGGISGSACTNPTCIKLCPVTKDC